MNQFKISIIGTLTILAALAFGYICFLSDNFLTLGNTQSSVVKSLVIIVLLCGLAFGAKWLKQTDRQFKTRSVVEIIMLAAFGVSALCFAMRPFPHYFSVYGHKTKIQTKLRKSFIQAENMFAEYEKYAENREKLYKQKLQSAVLGKTFNRREYDAYGFERNGVSDNTQIENKIFSIHADLFPSNFADMKDINSTWLTKSRNTVEQWKPIGIVDVVKEVEQYSKEKLEYLVGLSAVREPGEQAADFVYSLSFDDLKQYFTTPGKPAPLSISLAVLAYVIMLLPWFSTKRSSKRMQMQKTADYEVEL
jgi:hypothetical protein